MAGSWVVAAVGQERQLAGPAWVAVERARLAFIPPDRHPSGSKVARRFAEVPRGLRDVVASATGLV